MRAILAALGAMTLVAHAAPAPPPPPDPAPVQGTSAGCATNVPADFDRRVEAATKARDQAYAHALAKKQLTPWSKPVNTYSVDDDDGRPRRPRARSANTIDLGSFASGVTPNLELASDAHGTVFRVLRAPSSDGPSYVMCGCAPITHGGARIRFVRWAADLPAGTRFGGDVTIEYADRVPTTRYDGLRGGRPCPMPP